MKISRLLQAVLICTAIAFATPAPSRGEDKPKHLTVTDYFAMVPAGTMEVSGAALVHFLRQPGAGIEDKANGYLSSAGDGAQSAFQVALFRFKDDRPLLAICQGEVEGPDSVQLDFFELDGKGRMVKSPRSIFPVKENTLPINKRAAHSYELPRKGRTVLVRELRNGKVSGKFTWNGERFVAEK
jgi:hypothetical protein